MNYKTYAKFWDTQKGTRAGQCYGLLVLGTSLGVVGAMKTEGLGLAKRLGYGVIGGIGLGVLLIFVMIVPSMYLGYIRKRKAEGRDVAMHQMLLVLYFFPFLTFTSLGALVLILSLLT